MKISETDTLNFIHQDATGVNVTNNQNQEIPGSSCDLSSLDPLCNDSEEILRQLVENPFDVDSFFTEFNGADVKVSQNGILFYLQFRSIPGIFILTKCILLTF